MQDKINNYSILYKYMSQVNLFTQVGYLCTVYVIPKMTVHTPYALRTLYENTASR